MMHRKEKRTSPTDRTIVELFLVAAILVLITFAGTHTNSLVSGINCGTSYLSALCSTNVEKMKVSDRLKQ